MRQIGTVYSIQVLRCIAATLVVLFHAQQAFAIRSNDVLFAGEGYLFGFGAVGVHIFFVISGFIMVLTSVQPGKPFQAGKFLRRRLLRIYPIYWICVLIYVGVHSQIGPFYIMTAEQAIGALLLWPQDASLFIGPAWTLSYEMFFYLCFGLAMTLSLNRGLIALFAVFGMLIVAGHLLHVSNYNLYVATSPLLLEFLAGTAIGWLALNGRLPLRWGRALTALGLALFAAGIAYGYKQWPDLVMWGLPSTVLVMGLVCWEGDRGASPLVRRVAWLGDSSYVLYLIHILIIAIVGYLFLGLDKSQVPAPSVAALGVAVAGILAAEAIHRGLERPLLKLLNPKRSLVPPHTKENTPIAGES